MPIHKSKELGLENIAIVAAAISSVTGGAITGATVFGHWFEEMILWTRIGFGLGALAGLGAFLLSQYNHHPDKFH